MRKARSIPFRLLPCYRIPRILGVVALVGALHLLFASPSGGKEPIMRESTETIVRHAGGAGFWYPGKPEQLAGEVDRYLATATASPAPGRVVALVSPHAGYRFSGAVAGAAYRQVQGMHFDTVVVVGLSHRMPVRMASVFDGDFYETPLGALKVDKEVTRALLAHQDIFEYNVGAHATHKATFESGGEHSVENQVPFLQRTIGDFKMVEVFVNAENAGFCHAVGEAIAEALKGQNALLVASTDLTHFPSYEDANRIDRQALDVLDDFDIPAAWKGLSKIEQQNIDVFNLSCVMCSKAAVLSVFEAAKALGADEAVTLDYRNSGDTAGEKTRVVGYGAMALYDTDSPAQKVQSAAEQSDARATLTDEQKKALLAIARRTLETVTQGKPVPLVESDDPVMKEKRGCFVTLTRQGQLRGCIGRFDTDDPICQTTALMAESAALKDPRFPPVRPEEVAEIQIEMTVFPENPRRRIKDVDEIIIGKHGLYIKRGRYAGTLLPQVATDHGWNREEFLEHTCMKAFLPKDAWKDAKTEIYVYPGDIFHEE